MKLSTLGVFAFTAIATTAFVWMVKRPPVEGQVIQFGMPLQTATVTEKASDTPELADEKPAEASDSTEDSSSVESTSPVENPETEKNISEEDAEPEK